MNSDQIVKTIVLKSNRQRVWQAISDAAAFGSWFGMELDGPFEVGREMTARIVPTQVDPEVARMQEPHTGMQFKIWVEIIEPMKQFAFRWHPFAIDSEVDYSSEPTTLVTFLLSDAEGGTLLTITESGFDRIPLERRAQAFKANEGGWTHQLRLVEKYLELQCINNPEIR